MRLFKDSIVFTLDWTSSDSFCKIAVSLLALSVDSLAILILIESSASFLLVTLCVTQMIIFNTLY